MLVNLGTIRYWTIATPQNRSKPTSRNTLVDLWSLAWPQTLSSQHHSCCLCFSFITCKRPYLWCPPSLHALKDRWLLRGQTSDKISQYKNSRSRLFILDNKKWTTFYIKDDNGKLWVEVIIFTVLDTVATVDVLTASNNDVSFVETQTVHSAWPLNRRFVLSWKNRQSRPRFPALAPFACPPEIHRDIAFIPSILKRVKKMVDIVNEVYCVSGISLSTLEI